MTERMKTKVTDMLRTDAAALVMNQINPKLYAQVGLMRVNTYFACMAITDGIKQEIRSMIWPL